MKKLVMTTVVTAATLVATVAAAATFTYDYTLRYGMRGAEVVELQNCLNSIGYNVGIVDGIFGKNTKAGVKAFQADHGLTPDGIVGGMETGPALEQACNGSDDNSGSDNSGSDNSGSSDEALCPNGNTVASNCTLAPGADGVAFDGSGDEVSFTGSDMDDASDTTIEEAAEKASLGTFSFKNEDSAVKLEKADIILSPTTARDAGDEDDAWKVFEKLYLYVDGDLVASKEVDSRSVWKDRNIADASIYKDEDNRVRFSGLDKVLAKNEDHEIELKADIANSVDIDNTNAGNPWAWVVDETTFRFLDEAGLTSYLTEEDTNNELIANFKIVNAGVQDELEVSSSTADPEATTFEVKDNDVSDEYLAFAFDVKADEDGSDLEISKIQLTAQTGTAHVEDVIDEVTLKIGGKEETYDVSHSSGLNTTTATLVFDFDGKEITIPSGDEETAKVYVRFKSKNGGANYNDGETIKFSVTATDVDAWDVVGEDDLTASQLTGSATGETHSLYENGVIVSKGSYTISRSADSNGKTDSITYTMKVKVKAFGDAVYFALGADEAATPSGTNVIAYQFEDGSNAVVASTTASDVVSTDADLESGSTYRIDAGDEKTITLTVVLDAMPTVPEFYKVQLKAVKVYTDSALTNAVTVNLMPENDFESDPVLLQVN